MSDKSASLQVNDKSAAQPASPAMLKLVDPGTLYGQMAQIYDDIARRAFQMFERDGKADGRDLDHWLRAESELLHPVHVKIEESGDALNVQAEVPGFNANELQVSLEPRRLTISGKKNTSREHKDGNTIYKEQCSSEVFRAIDLPFEVSSSKASAALKNGILELTMPKASPAKAAQTQAKAASTAA